MENIVIPDDFYIYEEDGYKYLCHKSCVCIDGILSNPKFEYLQTRPVSNEDIIKLRYTCNMNDEIEEKTYFVDTKFNNLRYYVYDETGELSFRSGEHYIDFANVNDLLEYLAENYPECIRNNDIKIALKD
jgi:hypothetical protein